MISSCLAPLPSQFGAILVKQTLVFNVIIGMLCIAFGSYTVWIRRVHPERLGKLEAMKLFWGPTAGSVIHVVGYSVVPIVFGLVLTIAGLLGAPPFALGD